MAALRDGGLTLAIGVAPGPANGFTLDLIDCFERFGDRIDWAMVILNPLEPWPGELCLAAAERHGIRVITRVVDYGGLFWDDVLPGHEFATGDHRRFRPDGWIEAGRERLDADAPDRRAPRPDSDPARLPVEPLAPGGRLRGADPDPGGGSGGACDRGQARRARRASGTGPPRATPTSPRSARIGDNSGCMALKGASPDHDGEARPDRWPLTDELTDVARRWGIDPEHDLQPGRRPSVERRGTASTPGSSPARLAASPRSSPTWLSTYGTPSGVERELSRPMRD